MRKILLALAVLLAPFAAYGQAVQQSGSVTPGHVPYWVTNGVIATGGTASDSPITSLGVTNNGGNGICVSTGRSTAVGRQQLCLSASLNGAGVISLQNYGTATAQSLQFLINGTTITIPTGGGSTIPTVTTPLINNDAICANGTAGILKDCGVAIGAGTQWGLPYYSTTAIISSTAAGTNGQFLLGQTGAAPTWNTLSGDVASVSAGGALTLQKVNGIPFAFTYTAHGVLLGQGTSQFASTVTSNVGYCLISQGTSADPIWATCASGSGSAGGSNTQVQFNNSSSLAGSANLTWVSPQLTIGGNGTGTGQLGLAGQTSGIVTIQGQTAAGTYNFNLPTTAGTSGQPLLSGGGSSSPMSFGTLGLGGGGTNCTSASGTCLDNITGFASNGYIKRTGAGTYTQVSPIPVSDGGTNLASGTSGGILGYTGSGTLASSAALAVNGAVIGGGAGATPTAIAACTNGQIIVGVTSAAPACQTASGDISAISTGGAFTIANNVVTVGKMAQAAANTLLGNSTTSTANVTAFTIGGLTQKASPAATDQLLISDQAASGALKYATVSSIAAAGSVASIAGNTGAFTLGNGLTNSTNVLLVDATFLPRYIGGLTLSNDGGSPNTVLDIAAGMATDTTSAQLIKIAAFTKSTAGSWTAGSGNNGMGNGLTVGNNTWYTVCLAYNAGNSDAWFDTSAVCANKPSGVSGALYRRLGAFKTDGSAHIIPFTQLGNTFIWTTPVSDVSTTCANTTQTGTLASVPSGVVVNSFINAQVSPSGTNDAGLYVRPLFVTDQAMSAGVPGAQVFVATSGESGYADIYVFTNTSQGIGWRSNRSNGTCAFITRGWVDDL